MSTSIAFSLFYFVLYLYSPLVQAGGSLSEGHTFEKNMAEGKNIKAADGTKLFRDNCVQNLLTNGHLVYQVSLQKFPQKPGSTVIALVGEGKKGIATLEGLRNRCNATKEKAFIIHVVKDTAIGAGTRRSGIAEIDLEKEQIKKDLTNIFNSLLNAMKNSQEFPITVFEIPVNCTVQIVRLALEAITAINNLHFFFDGIGNNPDLPQQAIDASKLYALEVRNKLQFKHDIPGFAVNGSSFFEMQYYVNDSSNAKNKELLSQMKYALKAQTALMLNGFSGDQDSMYESCEELYLGMEYQLRAATVGLDSKAAMNHSLMTIMFNRNNNQEANEMLNIGIFEDVNLLNKAAAFFTVEEYIQ